MMISSNFLQSALNVLKTVSMFLLASVFYTVISGEINHGTMPVSHLSVQKLWCHYIDILSTISYKKKQLTVVCVMPAGVEKREKLHKEYFLEFEMQTHWHHEHVCGHSLKWLLC